MGVLAGILGGLLCGGALMILVAILSSLPLFGWMDYLTLPTFYVGGLISAIYIGLKYEQLVS